MLQLFKTNQPHVFIFLIIYAIILRAEVFLFPSDIALIDNTGILSIWLFDFLGNNPLLNSSLALLLVLAQGIYITRIANTYRISNASTYLPALSYILLCSLIPDFLHLSAPLLANTFLIIAISQLFRIYKKYSISSDIFNVGFWLGVGGLFYYPFFVFILVGIIGLWILHAVDLRKVLVVFIGFVLPVFFVSVYYFWHYDTFSFLPPMQAPSFSLFIAISQTPLVLTSVIVIMGLLVVYTFLNIPTYYQKANMQVRKEIDVLLHTLIVSIATLLFFDAFGNLSHLQLVMVPLSIFLSLNFLSYKRMIFPELIHLLLFAYVMSIQYFI